MHDIHRWATQHSGHTMLTTYILTIAACWGAVARAQSDGQLQEVSERIWAADQYRWPDSSVVVDVNGNKLFTYVDESRFGTPVNNLFRQLLDNYEPVIGVPETCGTACRNEEDAFLDEVLRVSSRPVRVAHDFLVQYGLAPADLGAFKELLRQYWFRVYSRSGGAALDSSGFEHVFMGEIRANGADVTGFHNWIQAYFEEKSGEFQYGNYQATCQPFNVKFGFSWSGASKPVSSMWVRTTPEVELALYTLCFLARTNAICNIRLEGVNNRMRAYDFPSAGVVTVGTVYPEC